MADKDHLILTAIGPDQVGLVQRISEFISRHGCNIEDSKMAVFCGEFAVIVLITGEAENLANIARNHHQIENETGLALAVKTPSSRKTGDAFLPADRLLHGSPWHCLPNQRRAKRPRH